MGPVTRRGRRKGARGALEPGVGGTSAARPAARPLVVIEGDGGPADAEIARAEAAGFERIAGFGAGPWPRPVVLTGIVRTEADAAAAVLAAIEGAGLIVEAQADRTTIDRLIDDLRHLGPVTHRTTAEPDVDPPSPEARAILALLAEGLTLGEAARSLGLSRRTADRRLAEARLVLGVERTTEAIARARVRGWLRPPADRA